MSRVASTAARQLFCSIATCGIHPLDSPGGLSTSPRRLDGLLHPEVDGARFGSSGAMHVMATAEALVGDCPLAATGSGQPHGSLAVASGLPTTPQPVRRDQYVLIQPAETERYVTTETCRQHAYRHQRTRAQWAKDVPRLPVLRSNPDESGWG